MKKHNPSLPLVRKLIDEQFPEFAHLPIQAVKAQGNDNRTFHLGHDMLIRLPTMECYALAVEKEHQFLPLLAPHLTVKIPVPLRMGNPSKDYPFHFSIYKWIKGETTNHIHLDDKSLEELALDLAQFLRELQSIDSAGGPAPDLHNWYRGDHIRVYGKDARKQIAALSTLIDRHKAMELWERAMATKWEKQPVWIHGDFASGNILLQNQKLVAIIDFGCMGVGDPACDLVIAWTFFKGKSREIFIHELNLDAETLLRAKAWALWKSTFELCQMNDKNNPPALRQREIIAEILAE